MSQFLPRGVERLTRLDFLDGVGIAVGELSVSLVHLRKRLMSVSLLAHRTVELPAAGEERARALAAAVGDFVRAEDVPTDRVFVSLPRASALMATLHVPAAAKSDLESVVDFEVDRLLPIPRDEVYFDHVVRERGDKLDLRIVAVPRAVVSGVLGALESAGVHPRSLVVTPAALADAVAFREDGEAPLVLVLHATDRAEIDVFDDGVFLSSRLFDANELALPAHIEARASAEAAAAGVSADELDVVEIPPGSDEKARQRSADLLGSIVERMNVAETARVGLAPAVLPALGAGLAAVREASVPLNLLPPEERRGAEEGAPVVTFFLAAVLALVTVVWLLGAVVQDYRIHSRLADQLALVEPRLREIRQQEAESRDLAEKIRQISRGQQGLATVYLRELTKIVPKDAYINTFRMRQGKIEIEGFAKEAAELIPAIDKSRHFSNPQFTSPVTKVKNNEERFSLTTRVSE